MNMRTFSLLHAAVMTTMHVRVVAQGELCQHIEAPAFAAYAVHVGAE